MKNKWITHKFGGTSVAGAERYRHVAKIIIDYHQEFEAKGISQAVVVSAMSKVTDSLIEVVTLAANQNNAYKEKLQQIKLKHFEEIKKLLLRPDNILAVIEADINNIDEILRATYLTKTSTPQTMEFISGHGELWSAQILNAHLNELKLKSNWLDARSVLKVEGDESRAVVIWDESQKNTDEWFARNDTSFVVITGFIASHINGVATTLKRNGSDFSASIFGKLLHALKIIIWTDVDGVLSADPRLVPEAVVLDNISYYEATELAYFGAKVVHPDTMLPAIKDSIPIWIKNTFHPEKRGTCISGESDYSQPVKGFSTVDKICLVNVEGTGMIGVPGVANRLFGALREVGVSVIMISQASSEQSICLAVPGIYADKTKSALSKAFFAEIQQGLIQNITIKMDCCILAIVGDGMVRTTGVAAKFFSALGRAGVNIQAIAQGSSERNISAVISSAESQRALRAVHSAFFLLPQTLSVGIIGSGLIGKTLLKQLQEQTSGLKKSKKIDIKIRAIANSKKMLLNEQEISLSTWENDFNAASETLNLNKLVEHIKPSHLPFAVIIDCTSDEKISDMYDEWMKQGIHIITPNKKANSGSYSYYQLLRDLTRQKSIHYLCETTVGAGLPVLRTLRDLIETGDEVIEIQGILSGTLSYIFNTFNAETKFSEVVVNAKKQGFTEPDPRDDLSGVDFARKLVILGRESGLKLELSDVKIQSLVPIELLHVSVDEFINKLPAFDEKMDEKLNEAQKNNSVLRYVGSISQEGKAEVRLEILPKNHPFASLSGSDNIVLFKTKRYCNQPMVIRGPGAGPEVTAAGVFADILRLASYLGAPS